MSRRRPRRRFSWQISFCQAAPGDKSSTVSPALTTARPLCAKQSKKRKKKEKIERICTTEAVVSAQQKQSYLHNRSSRICTTKAVVSAQQKQPCAHCYTLNNHEFYRLHRLQTALQGKNNSETKMTASVRRGGGGGGIKIRKRFTRTLFFFQVNNTKQFGICRGRSLFQTTREKANS